MNKDTQQQQIETVQVAIRIRPITERDRLQSRQSNDVLKAQTNEVHVVSQNKHFTYDHVFGPDVQQDDIFLHLGQKPVEKFVEGYNVTMLAYGQTSSGKTYTMGTHNTENSNPENEGIVPRAMALLFDMLRHQNEQLNRSSSSRASLIRPPSQISYNQKPASVTYRYSVKVSFIEIYNEELVDLLNLAPPAERPPVTIREDTKGHIYWTGVKEMTVSNTSDVLQFLQQGSKNRATGSTDMNEKSSRSHAIFSVTLKQEKWQSSSNSRTTSSAASRASSPPSKLKMSQQNRLSNKSNGSQQDDNGGEWITTVSKFHFVDLAGSERLKRTAAEGDRRREGININAGLLALGNVISALGDPSKKRTTTHIPYRDSKLTRLLQDSLGGTALTLMIACVSPTESNLSETLNTLQYANRARNIKNKVSKNEQEEWMTSDNIDFLRDTIAKLKRQLTKKPIEELSPSLSSNSSDDDLLSVSSSTTSSPNMVIADLQQQVQGTTDFIKDHSTVVEPCLDQLQLNQQSLDFQHLVEPVIEEYEKSMSGLESQLALVRAALQHADQGIQDQQSQIHDQQTQLQLLETIIKTQEETIHELRKRVQQLLEDRTKDELYIGELEKKLMTAVEETAHDREMLNKLRAKILSLKEVDETTEKYIHELEKRMAETEKERDLWREKYEACEQQRTNLDEQLECEKSERAALSEQLAQKDIIEKELRDKYEKCEKKQQELQAQLDEQLKSTNMTLKKGKTTSLILYDLDVLKRKHEQLKTELQLQKLIRNGDKGFQGADDDEGVSISPDDMVMEKIQIKYEVQCLDYKNELRELSTTLKEVKKLKANETSNKASSAEHKMLLKTIITIDRQLSEEYEKVKLEAKRFTNDFTEMLAMHQELNSLIKKKEEASRKNDDEQISKSTMDSGALLQYEKTRHALQTRLVIATEDLWAHKTILNAFKHKFQTSQIALVTYHRQVMLDDEKEKDEPAAVCLLEVTDREIEELMMKMDAMKLQLESNDWQG
ncbi:MAG: P-loop containing nucleoside triphosphate hydrolase protein [Benjaminiella poitrasii]|nr:MAG: P-loop containing nucleoside triphosphate hydrolase protein [Benjaminiella poitrasii]